MNICFILVAMVDVLIVRAAQSNYVDAMYFDGELHKQGYGLTSVPGVLGELVGETIDSVELRNIEIEEDWGNGGPFPEDAAELPTE